MDLQNKEKNEQYPIGEEYTIFNKLTYVVGLLNLILVQQQNMLFCSLISRLTKSDLKKTKSIPKLVAEFEQAYPDLMATIESDPNANHPMSYELLREIHYLCDVIGISKYSKKLGKSKLLILAKGTVVGRNNVNLSKGTVKVISDLYRLRSLLKNYTASGDGALGSLLNKMKSGDLRLYPASYDKGIELLASNLSKSFIKDIDIAAHPDVAELTKQVNQQNKRISPSHSAFAFRDQVLIGSSVVPGSRKTIEQINLATSISSVIAYEVDKLVTSANAEIDRNYFLNSMEQLNKQKIISRINAIQNLDALDAIPAFSDLAKFFSDRLNACHEKLKLKKPVVPFGKIREVYALDKAATLLEVTCILMALSKTIRNSVDKAPLGINPLLSVAEAVGEEAKLFLKSGIKQSLLADIQSTYQYATDLIETKQVEFITATRQSVFENVTQLVIAGGSEELAAEDLAFAKEMVDTGGESVFVEIHTPSKTKDNEFSFNHSDIVDADIVSTVPLEDEPALFTTEDNNLPTSTNEADDLLQDILDLTSTENTESNEAFSSSKIDEAPAIIAESKHDSDTIAELESVRAELGKSILAEKELSSQLTSATQRAETAENKLAVCSDKSNDLAIKLLEAENNYSLQSKELLSTESSLTSAKNKLTNTLEILSELEIKNAKLESIIQQAKSNAVDNSLSGQLNQLIGMFDNFTKPISDTLLELDLSIGKLLHDTPDHILDPEVQDKLHELFDIKQQASQSNPKFINDMQASKMSKKSNSGLKATDFDPSLHYSLDTSTLRMILDKQSSLIANNKTPTVSDIRSALNLTTNTLSNLKGYEDFEQVGQVTDQARHLVSYQAKTGLKAVKEMALALINQSPSDSEMIERVFQTFIERYQDKDLKVGDSTLEVIIGDIRSAVDHIGSANSSAI